MYLGEGEQALCSKELVVGRHQGQLAQPGQLGELRHILASAVKREFKKLPLLLKSSTGFDVSSIITVQDIKFRI